MGAIVDSEMENDVGLCGTVVSICVQEVGQSTKKSSLDIPDLI
jgi:hypothetical protein